MDRGKLVFHISPSFALDHEGCPLIPFRIFVDHKTKFNSSVMEHLRWSYL